MSAGPARALGRGWGLALAAFALLAVCVLSLRIGSIDVTSRDVFDALFRFDPDSYNQTVVRELRVPRTVMGIGVGAALAVAGALMQAITRNPLADPSILGVNSGASFAIVTAIYFLGLTHPYQYVWIAFVGAGASSTLGYAIASAGRGGATPVKLALAGVVVTALLSSWITTLLLLDTQTLDVVRFWLAGSLAGRTLDVFWLVTPFLAAGLLGAVLLARQLNVMNLGEDAARALGLHTGRLRVATTALVVVMSGAAVSAAGPIGFIGLAVPHIVRAITGPDHRWVLAYCVVTGPLLLIGADIVGRVVARPAEVQVGIITAMCGAPFLIAIARSRRVASL